MYFRVAESFKNEFTAAAMVREQDPSDAFRVIGRAFIERVKQESPERYSETLEVVRGGNSAQTLMSEDESAAVKEAYKKSRKAKPQGKHNSKR